MGNGSMGNALLPKGTKGNDKKQDKSKITCFNYQKNGHYASDCSEAGQEDKEDDLSNGNRGQSSRVSSRVGLPEAVEDAAEVRRSTACPDG